MGPWLTRITPSASSADARRDAGDVVEQYRTVMRLAPDGLGEAHRAAAGLLWRREDSPAGPRLIVQTATKPLVENLPGDYGDAEVRDISQLIQHANSTTLVRFRCVASPVVAVGESGARSKRVALRREDEQAAWWERKARAAGLEVLDLTVTPQRAGRSRLKPRLSVPLVGFEGVARVTGSEELAAAVLAGIGPNRVMGAGLLTIAPR